MNYCESCKHGGNCEHEWRYSKLVYGCEKYAKVMTNKQWLQSCTTEQLADVLADVSLWIHPFMKQKNRFELLKKQFYVWLKQPHKE